MTYTIISICKFLRRELVDPTNLNTCADVLHALEYIMHSKHIQYPVLSINTLDEYVNAVLKACKSLQYAVSDTAREMHAAIGELLQDLPHTNSDISAWSKHYTGSEKWYDYIFEVIYRDITRDLVANYPDSIPIAPVLYVDVVDLFKMYELSTPYLGQQARRTNIVNKLENMVDVPSSSVTVMHQVVREFVEYAGDYNQNCPLFEHEYEKWLTKKRLLAKGSEEAGINLDI